MKAEEYFGDWIDVIDKAEIDTDFEKFYFISSEFDDPLSLDNSRSSCYEWRILLET